MRRWVKWTIGGVAVLGAGFVLLTSDLRPHVEYVPETVEEPMDTVLAPPDVFGIPMAGFVLEQGTVKPGDTFGDLLARHGVPMATVQLLVERAAPDFDVRLLRSGHPYAFIFPADSAQAPAYFVYEPDAVDYVVFGLQDSLEVRRGKRPVETSMHEVACTVSGALYNDLSKAGADPTLAMQLADIYAWTVDFYRIQKGDVFSVVYEARTVDGQRYGQPRVLAARYTSGDQVKAAFKFGEGRESSYYDQEGASLRKAFLKAPLKYSRISSGFSSRRLHPVQKRFKAHLGTDYAAPYGTPILAVGDGTVEKAGRTGGNGNFVKIRHNGTYSTQYLHMRKILVKQGQRVSQGDVIGEVGSTGLATGPHVCYRFWKNGVQVDHRREELPSAEPVADSLRPAFDRLRDSLSLQLDEAELASAQGRLVNF